MTAGDPFKALVGPIHELSCTFSLSLGRYSCDVSNNFFFALPTPDFTLKNPTPENKAKVEQACADHAKMVDGKMTYGWSVEDPNTVLAVHSWESVEVRRSLFSTLAFISHLP
jgi:hypothetical protein